MFIKEQPSQRFQLFSEWVAVAWLPSYVESFFCFCWILLFLNRTLPHRELNARGFFTHNKHRYKKKGSMRAQGGGFLICETIVSLSLFENTTQKSDLFYTTTFSVILFYKESLLLLFFTPGFQTDSTHTPLLLLCENHRTLFPSI